jgi:toxin FitB
MYLADTNVISETKRKAINAGVRAFFDEADAKKQKVHLSVITFGELRRGVDLARHKGDLAKAVHLERWLAQVLRKYASDIIAVDRTISEMWGNMRVPRSENPLDKLIAATASRYGLTVVTRNVKDFRETGVEVINPFE